MASARSSELVPTKSARRPLRDRMKAPGDLSLTNRWRYFRLNGPDIASSFVSSQRRLRMSSGCLWHGSRRMGTDRCLLMRTNGWKATLRQEKASVEPASDIHPPGKSLQGGAAYYLAQYQR